MPEAGFRHQLLPYACEDDLLAAAVPYLREGLQAGGAVLIAVSARRAAALRGELGRDAAAARFLDTGAIGSNPGRMIPFWREAVDEHAGAGIPVRAIAEPDWRALAPHELDEWLRHERLLNVAFDGDPAWSLLCPYDAAVLPPDVLDGAARAHPLVAAEGGPSPSAGWSGVAAGVLAGVLEAPPERARRLWFDRGGLHRARAMVAEEAGRAGLDRMRSSDLVTATSELVANSVAHGGGRGMLWAWTEGGEVVVDVSDTGIVDDPLVGRVKPLPTQEGGRGLWIANLLCDLVQLRSGPGGTSVRLRMATDRSAVRPAYGQSGSTGLLSFQ
jgi:anti-sigma regulatory factor (Ser/Thr protein kinase)